MTKNSKGAPETKRLAHMVKDFTVSENAQKALGQRDIEILERAIEDLKKNEVPIADLVDPAKFSADPSEQSVRLAARQSQASLGRREEPVTPEHMDVLLAYLPRLRDPGQKYIEAWQGNVEQPDGSRSFPYPAYAPVVHGFFSALGPPWTDHSYDPNRAAKMLEDDALIASASLEQIRTMFTFMSRSERFGDGNWGGFLQSGRVQKVLQRLQVLRAEVARPLLERRVLGCVLGAAVGDALGHPTEFMRSYAAIQAAFGPSGVQGYALHWERDGRQFAPYTDDTQMAEIVLRALIESRRAGADLDATMRAMAAGFIEWAEHPQGGHRAPGNACLAGCRRLAAGARWDQAGAGDAGGCGSVMRAYPFGVIFHDQPEKAEAWAVAHSKLTHGAPIALAACAAMAAGVASCMAGHSPAEVVETMRAAAARHDGGTAVMIADAARAAAGNEPEEKVLERLQGWAAHEAIAAGTYVFCLHSDGFVAAALRAANTPGDSDSIATIAGALVGARLGVEAIPADWIMDLERTEELSALALDAVKVLEA